MYLFLFIIFNLCVYILAVLGLRGYVSFPLVASSQDHSLVERRGLIVVASLVGEHKVLRLQELWFSGSGAQLNSCGAWI